MTIPFLYLDNHGDTLVWLKYADDLGYVKYRELIMAYYHPEIIKIFEVSRSHG